MLTELVPNGYVAKKAKEVVDYGSPTAKEKIRMTRTKAAFKALRESAGLSQQNVADALDVNISTAKRWEKPSFPYDAPDDAWEYLEGVKETQEEQVSFMLAAVAEQVEQMGKEPVVVPITYYRDQKMYDEFGRDPGPFGWPNAVARKVVYELERRGIACEFRYPTEGAVRTPGSNY